MELVTKTDPRTPCGHAYCVECLKQLFMSSMQDETLMPPRCCRKEIPIDLVQLTLKEIEDFNAKRLEYLTSNRLYCSQPTCSAFIPPELIINNVGTCPEYVQNLEPKFHLKNEFIIYILDLIVELQHVPFAKQLVMEILIVQKMKLQQLYWLQPVRLVGLDVIGVEP